MRVALARALFIQPEFLLLDEREWIWCVQLAVAHNRRQMTNGTESELTRWFVFFDALRDFSFCFSHESLGYGSRSVSRVSPSFLWPMIRFQSQYLCYGSVISPEPMSPTNTGSFLALFLFPYSMCRWLEEYLSKWDKILFFVCHSQDFMNQVCTHIVRLDMTYKKLRYFSGNYDMYVQTRRDQDMVQMRQYESEQRDIAEIKDFIARFGHGTVKMVRQAQAREKLLEKKLEAGLTELPEQDPDWGELLQLIR